jgi:hypothetical protein
MAHLTMGAPAAPPTPPWWLQKQHKPLLPQEHLGQVLTFQQIGQWDKDLCNFWQKPTVKINMPKNPCKSLTVCGLGK